MNDSARTAHLWTHRDELRYRHSITASLVSAGSPRAVFRVDDGGCRLRESSKPGLLLSGQRDNIAAARRTVGKNRSLVERGGPFALETIAAGGCGLKAETCESGAQSSHGHLGETTTEAANESRVLNFRDPQKA